MTEAAWDSARPATGSSPVWAPPWPRRRGGSRWSTPPWSAITPGTTTAWPRGRAAQETEKTLEGLRYVRNQLGGAVDPAEFVRPAGGDSARDGTWRPLPEPELDERPPRARLWELSRYTAYQARLAAHSIGETFARCTEFLGFRRPVGRRERSVIAPSGRWRAQDVPRA